MVYIPWTIEHLEKGLLLLLLPVLHPFNGLFSRTTWVSRYQKGKTSLDLNEARDDGVSGWWHKLDNVQTICTSLQKFREITTSAARHSVEGFNRLLVKYEEKNWQAEQVPTLSHYVILACRVRCKVLFNVNNTWRCYFLFASSCLTWQIVMYLQAHMCVDLNYRYGEKSSRYAWLQRKI